MTVLARVSCPLSRWERESEGLYDWDRADMQLPRGSVSTVSPDWETRERGYIFPVTSLILHNDPREYTEAHLRGHT